MKIAYRFLFAILISMFLFGCGDKTASVEGKIVDGLGKPQSGISLIFKQVQPTQGYEQFETKTGADGVFRLTGVAPSSEYIITLLSDKWKTKVTKKIKTLEAGQNLVLSAPIKIRFYQMKEGTVYDTKTGLQWLIYPVADITASNAISTVKGLKEAGFTDWRLPSRQELAGLQEEKAPTMTPTGEPPALISKTCCAWVAEPNTEEVDWKFYVEEDNELWSSSKATPDNRIIVVRNIMPSPVAAAVPPVAKPDESQKAAAVPAPAIAPITAEQPAKTATVQTETPSVKSPGGVRHASRKACAEKKAQATKAAPMTTPSPAKAVPSAVTTAAVKTDNAKVIDTASAKKSEPVKIAEPAKSSSASTPLYFDVGSAALKSQELVKLKSFYSQIKGGKGTLVIDGHSDASASSARHSTSNLMLSIDRSSNVVVALNRMGLSNKIKVELRALGDTKPAASNDTAEGRKLNRRVDISFIPE